MPISRNRPPRAPDARPLPNAPRGAPGGAPGGTLGGAPGRGRGRRPLSGRNRIIQRVLIALLAGCTLLILQRTGMLDKLSTGVVPQNLDWTNDYQLVEHLRSVVVDDGLTKDSKDCLLFIINGNDLPTGTRMDVMEKHSGSCPGKRGELPKLFTLKVDRTAHTVQTDSGSPGQFHPLP